MKKLKQYFSTVLTLFFAAILVGYFLLNLESFRPLLEVSVLAILAIILLKTFVFSIHGMLIKITIELFNKKMGLVEAFFVSIYSAIGNFFGPLLGGASVRAVYLKKRHGLSYAKYVSTLYGYFFALFFVNSLLAVVSLFLIQSTTDTNVAVLLLFFGAWLLFMLGLALTKLPDSARKFTESKSKMTRVITRQLFEAYDGWRLMIKHPQMMLKLFLLALGVFGSSYVINFIQFSVLDIPVGLPALGLYTALSIVSVLMAITPGAIGIRESLLVVSGSALGLSVDEIIQVSILDRALTYITLAILFVIARTMDHKYRPETHPEPESSSTAAV